MNLSKEIRKLKRLKKAVTKKGSGPAAGMAMAGFSLSPLSIWNEGYINLPIAYVSATAVSAYSQDLFTVSLIFFYWLTNFIGLILLELGIETVLHKKRHLSAKLLLLDVLASILITCVLVYLIHLNIIRPIKF